MGQDAITYKDVLLKIGSVSMKVQDLSIKEAVNKHSKLHVTALLRAEDQQQVLYGPEKTFVLSCVVNGSVRSLFQGLILDIQMETYGELFMLHMSGETASYLLDIDPVSRLFQDRSMTSHELMEEIMKDYPDIQYTFAIPNEPIHEIMLQYQETDWEFFKRFLSRYGEGIYVDCSGFTTKLQMGLEKQEPQKDWTEKPCKIQYSEEDRAHYFIRNRWLKSYEIVSIAKSVTIDERNMYIGSVERTLVDGLLENEYTLYYKNSLRFPKYYNERMIGISVNANVVDVYRNRVQVISELDHPGPKNRYWFPFSTVAASSDGSGWHCMPEKGGQVRLFFPEKKERKGYVITNMQGHNPKSPQEDDPMGDPNTKSINASNKTIVFHGGGITINAGRNGSVSLSQDGSVILDAKDALGIAAAESIIINAGNELDLSANGEISMKSDAGHEVLIQDGELLIDAEKIHFNLPETE